MKDSMDGDTVFAVIMMMRQVDQRAVILVEGQEDTAIIDPHLNSVDCRSEIGFGKKAVLRAARLANENGINNVFAVVDRDFDQIEDIKQEVQQVSVSEFYDLEVDIFNRCPDALTRVLAAHTDRDRMQSHLTKLDTEVRQLVTEIAGHVGLLRQLSISRQLGVRLKDFPMSPLVDAYETGDLVSRVALISVGRSKETISISALDLEELLVAELKDARLDLCCCGHDVVHLLSALTSVRWGGPSGADALGRAFRSSVGWECFNKLLVCTDLREWGKERSISVWRRDLAA